MIIDYSWLNTLLSISALMTAAVAAHFITRHFLLRIFDRLTLLLPGEIGGIIVQHRVIRRLTLIVPMMVISFGIDFLPDLPEYIPVIVTTITQIAVLLLIAMTISSSLNVVNELYMQSPESHGRPIKGYLQMVKIIISIVITLLIIGTILDRDVLTLLAGLGAMMAVIMLIFQNTILSLVASMQVSSYDMVRLGDWIEMPALNADGNVTDITLHTIKVSNWDKTITTIPTSRLLTETFKNWRGMTESRGRRIKRALMIDQSSVRFLTDDERRRFHNFFLLDDYLTKKENELKEWNSKLMEFGKNPVNTRRITNLGTFRAYVIQYLEQHSGLNHSMTKLVRQLDPTPEGLPLQLWCFTSSTEWKVYESIQADIFDHLLSILPEFGLRIFQHPSGTDWQELIKTQRLKEEKYSERKSKPGKGVL